MQLDSGALAVAADVQFTAVVPTYNRARLIKRAIESVLNQTYPPREVIVVDDGSSDNTRAVLTRFGSQITPIYQDNGGSAVARHKGILAAQCDWIALLDSDDIWLPNHLERMATVIAETDGAANFYFADTIQPDGGSFWAAHDFAVPGPYQLLPDATAWVLPRCQPMLLQASVFNRAAYMASGGFLPPLRLRDDTHLYLKLGLGGPACAVAGFGTQMTADDDPNNRLTLTYENKKRAQGHQMQVIMFRDLLATMAVSAPIRAELKNRLALAYVDLAGHAWRDRQWGTAVKQLVQSVRVNPSALASRITGRVIKQYGVKAS